MHSATLRLGYDLALWYKEMSRQDDALRLMTEISSAQKIELGELHPDTYSSTITVVNIYWISNQDDVAILINEQIITFITYGLSIAHPQSLTAMLENILLNTDDGRVAEALKHAESPPLAFWSSLS